MSKNKPVDKSMIDRQLRQIEQLVSSNHVSITDLNSYAKVDYPIFSFKYLIEDTLQACATDFFKSFLTRLKKLSELGWRRIELAPRHSFGTELIPVCDLKIKDKMPSIINKDDKVTVFRAAGNNLPFIGKREGVIFHIIAIETKFGELYKHG